MCVCVCVCVCSCRSALLKDLLATETIDKGDLTQDIYPKSTARQTFRRFFLMSENVLDEAKLKASCEKHPIMHLVNFQSWNLNDEEAQIEEFSFVSRFHPYIIPSLHL